MNVRVYVSSNREQIGNTRTMQHNLIELRVSRSVTW